MKAILFSASAVAALALVPGLAAADGWYGSASVGYNFDGGVEFDNVPNASVAGFTGVSPYGIGRGANGDGGWGAGLALGYAFSNGFRVEAELLNSQTDFNPKGVDGVDGAANLWAGMVNAYYDFNRDGAINPFIGAGVGLGRVDVTASSFDRNPANNTPLLILSRQSAVGISDSDSGFAWQVMAGVGLKLSERLSGDVTFRYLTVPDLEFAGFGRFRTNAFGGSATQPLTVGGTYGSDFGSGGGILGVGLRYQLSAPPPPPPPPAPLPPPPARVVCDGTSFVVYFEHDRSFLTDQANEVITNEVNDIAARNCIYSSVLIQGHADTSGNPRYNIALSERRVTVVSEALVARGVPADLMTGEAFGESRPAVATGDGVKEPLNRRTEVTFSFQ